MDVVFLIRSSWCGRGSGSCLSLMRIRILPYLPVWCLIGSWSIFRSKLLNKGSKPWKSAQIGSYSINFGLSFANWWGSGSGLSLGCGSDVKSSLHNLLRFTTCIEGLVFECVCVCLCLWGGGFAATLSFPPLPHFSTALIQQRRHLFIFQFFHDVTFSC